MNLKERKKIYNSLSIAIANLSTEKLGQLLLKNKTNEGWGSNHLLKIKNEKVFVKKIPLTNLEYTNQFSTKNLFNLPLFYNYGVGSAGLGAFRELNAHLKTTNWVLTNTHQNFPLLYHFRIIPRIESLKKFNPVNHKKYIEYWNNSKEIDVYIKARRKAKYELVLFLEHIPFTLNKWLVDNNGRINFIADEMFKTFSFLKRNGIVHFDAHLANILTDGKRPYLTDFGLLLDKSFELSKAELKFLNAHSHYDFCEFVGSASSILDDKLSILNTTQKTEIKNILGISERMTPIEQKKVMLANLDLIARKKILKMNKNYVSFLRKHQSLILLADNFFSQLRRDNKKSIKYNDKPTKKILNSKTL